MVIDYQDLVSTETNLTDAIKAAFGSEAGALGVCLIKNVPGFVAQRERLLKLASVFANLPEEVKAKCEHKASSYLFGWSHGKEFMNGKNMCEITLLVKDQ